MKSLILDSRTPCGRCRRLEYLGSAGLVSATVIVGASILAEGGLGRVLNGISGLIWAVSAVLLVLAARESKTRFAAWGVLIVTTATVAFVIRPSDLVLAIVGFTLAGAVAAIASGNRPMLWAKLVPALYLPMHIGTAVTKAAYRSATGADASIRSEPPPTAFIVPVVMFAAAVGGGLIVKTLVLDRRQRISGYAERGNPVI